MTIGRPTKGPRTRLTVRLPTDLLARLDNFRRFNFESEASCRNETIVELLDGALNERE